MKNLAPDIFRQRLCIEGFYKGSVDAKRVEKFLLEAAAALGLRTYAAPVVFSPSEGMGRDENAGFDGFVPLIDSGISIYVWTQRQFVSTVFYTCKEFSKVAAVDFTQQYFAIDEIAQMSF